VDRKIHNHNKWGCGNFDSRHTPLVVVVYFSIHKEGNVAIGDNADSTGADGGISIGPEITNSGSHAIAIGDGTVTNSARTIVMGLAAVATADDGQAYGNGSEVDAEGAIMMGHHSGQVTNSRSDSFALGWNETLPSLWIEKYTTTTSGVAGTSTVDIPLDASSTYVLNIRAVGGEDDASPTMYAARTFDVLAHRDGSGNVVVDGQNGGLLMEAGGENKNITVTASTTNVRITFTGPDTTSTDMNWRAVVQLTKVDSN